MATIRKDIEALIAPKQSANGDSGNTKGEGYNVYFVTSDELDAIAALLSGVNKFTELFYNITDNKYYVWDFDAQDFTGILNWQSIIEAPDQAYYYRLGNALYDGWIGAFSNVYNPTTVAISRDVLYATLFHVSRGIIVDKQGIEVTTLGVPGSLLRIGIYEYDEVNGRPGALIYDSGTVTGDSIAVKKITLAAAQSLPNGKYCQVVVHNSPVAINVRAFSATAGQSPAYSGVNIDTFTAGAPNRFSVAFTFAALPATFPTVGLTHTNATIPNIMLHPSAFL